MDTQFVFVHQDGPKLRRSQTTMVRSTAMYVARRQKRKAAAAAHREAENNVPDSGSAASGTDRIESALITDVLPPALLRELGQPPEYLQTSTGLNAKLYRDYIHRTESCGDVVDEGFLLVGFRKPSLYLPEPDKKLCVLVGWLFASALTDAIRGTADIVYPYEELMTVQELGDQIAKRQPTVHVVTAIMILGLFEILRSGTHATKHMTALEHVVAMEGGIDRLKFLPRRQTMILIDLLHAVSFNTRLRFVEETLLPIPRAEIHANGEGYFFASSPLVIFNSQDFSLLSKFIDADVVDRLASVLEYTFDRIEEVYRHHASPGHGDAVQDPEPSSIAGSPARSSSSSDTGSTSSSIASSTRGAVPNLDELAGPVTLEGGVPQLILQSCALGSRIFFRTLERRDGLDNGANRGDMRALHRNLKFLGLRSWAGLPYIFAWLLLIGASAATTRERPFFVGQLARIAASYGGYHVDMLTLFFQNFLHLRRILVSSRVTTEG